MQLLNQSSSRVWPPILLTLIIAVLWIGEQMRVAPQARTDAVPSNEFSAQRAQLHVVKIARTPHPAGSPANAQVRDYLMNTLRDLGGEVDLQRKLKTYNYLPRAGKARFANVENIVAVFPGRQSGPALLLMAHYDSVPHGPGAGDDASGVAAVLETVRALAASGLPMRNTLIVLFSDAEEVGLIGAQAFFDNHHLAEQVELVLNFDSRGNRGPVFMYETSEPNGALIDALARVAPSPSANSLVHSIFQKVPKFNDMVIATKAGKAGMNFAFIDGYYDFHSSTDTAERLSLDSLQHLGSFSLPLARHFGEVKLPIVHLPNRHYFNPIGQVLVSYPAWVDGLLWFLSLILLIFSSIQAIKRDAFALPQLLRGIGCAMLLIAVPALLVLSLDRIIDQAVVSLEVVARQREWFVAWALLATGIAVWLQGSLRTGLGWLPGLFATSLLVGLTLVGGLSWLLLLVAFITGMSLTLLLRHPLVLEARIVGALWLLLLLALAVLLQLPGGAHVLLWPLLTISLLQAWRWRHANGKTAAPHVWLLAGLPAIVLLGATALTFDLLIGYTLPIVSVFPLLLMLLFYPPLMEGSSARVCGLVVTLLGAAGLGWLALTPPWSAEKPQPVSLFVLHDADQQRTYWASGDQQLSEWNRAILGSNPQLASSVIFQPDSPEKLWLSPIHGITVATPQIELIAANVERRRLSVRVKPDQAGDTVTIWLKPNTDLRAWQVEGQPLQFAQDDSKGWRSLTGFALPSGGVEITLDLGMGSEWPELLLTSVHNGLPEELSVLPGRSKELRRANSFSDSTVTVRHWVVDALHQRQ